jgi:hypothetical protein
MPFQQDLMNAADVLPTTSESAAFEGTDGDPGVDNKFVTDSDPRLPSDEVTEALEGTDGAPAAGNKFVTDSDPRLVGTSSFSDQDFNLTDNADDTKRLEFALDGATANKTLVLASDHTDHRVVTFPDTAGTLESQTNKNAADGYAGLDPGALITKTLIMPEAHQIDGGVLAHNGFDFTQGFYEPDDNTVHADWADVTGSSTISKSNGTWTITVANGTRSNYYNVAEGYDAARMEMALPAFSRWEAWTCITGDNVNETGGYLGVRFEDTDAQHVILQKTKHSGSHNVNGIHGEAQWDLTGTGAGANEGWVKLVFDGSYIYYLYSNNAVDSEPGENDWTVGVNPWVVPVLTWSPINMVLMFGAINYGAKPGCTIDFYRPRWRRI